MLSIIMNIKLATQKNNMAYHKNSPWSQANLPHTLVAPRSSSINSERFSLLLLEFGEIYFEDFSAIYYPMAPSEAESVEIKQRGRLKLCSQSILFDPLDFTYPIIKVSFKDCKTIQLLKHETSSKFPENTFVMVATQLTEMLEWNIIAPFKFVKEERRLLFSLTYGSIDSVLSQIITLEHAVRLPRADQNAVIENVVITRQSQVSFNTSWLENLYEEQVLETYGEHVTPLVSNPGRIMLTSSRIYFQPFNNVEVDPVVKLELSSLKHVMKRRYMLRHVGLELFTKGGLNIFLVLSSTSKRNNLYTKLVALPEVELQQLDLEEITQKWQNEEIPNYDYLTCLNFMADRSYSDIMQYPVMPWIISDYTSNTLDLQNPATFRDLTKPIGALNEERLAFFKERYSDMSGKKFLYGTHYSAPGYVLYYLVRTAPEYLLCLQNGKFDQPNRLFHSIATTWNNVFTDHADVKELIPEFYEPPGDFLLNLMNLDLGIRTDGARVNDIMYPPWAKDANDFTEKCRAALECDYVSERLNHWIDLIFGYKQQGVEAMKSNNLFHYLTYESSSNMDHMIDPEMRAAIELQIKEFGQTPKQLFRTPHPKRILHHKSPKYQTVDTSNIDDSPDVNNDSLSGTTDWVMINSEDVPSSDEPGASNTYNVLKLKTFQKSHKEALSSIRLSHDCKMVFSVSNDKTLKVHQVNDWQMLRSSSISSLPLSSISVLSDSKTVVVGSWDNNVYIYSVEFAAVVGSCYAHDSSVTCVCWRSGIMATGSWDSTVKVWKLPSCNKPPSPEVITELDHDNEVTCLDIDSNVKFIASGLADGFVAVWNIEHQAKEFELKAHESDVLAITFNPDGSAVCSCGKDLHIKLLSVEERSEIISSRTTEQYNCVAWMKDRLLCGGVQGTLYLLNATTLNTITKVKNHTDTITCIDISSDHELIVTGSKDKCIGVWSIS